MSESVSVVKTETRNITLKGSVKVISEYLSYGIHSILFQRGVYPPESFKAEEHFGLSILMSTDDKINAFLDSVIGQMKEFLNKRQIEQISMVIMRVSTKEALERWDFKIQYEDEGAGGEEGTKEVKTIQKEIREVLLQICSTVSFLPLLDGPCSFDLHLYAKKDADVPEMWNETTPIFIQNSQELQLRSFSTSFHRMNTVVSYKAD